jgi:diacylglycerol kinase family enzyme
LDDPQIQVCLFRSKLPLIIGTGKYAAGILLNTADIGLGAMCMYSRLNRNSKAMGGFFSFLKAALTAIVEFRNHKLSISVDGKIAYNGESSLVYVGNGRFFGVGMMIAPCAELDDEWFDVVILKDFRKIELLRNLPLVYRGNHLNHPKIIMLRGREVEIRCEPRRP